MEFTLLQHGAVCVYRLVDDGLSVGGLCNLLTLHADLLALCDHRVSREIATSLTSTTRPPLTPRVPQQQAAPV